MSKIFPIKIYLCRASKLTRKEKYECKNLTLKYGIMWPSYIDNKNKKTSYIALAKKNNTTIGWGLLFLNRDDWCYSKYSPTIYLYVKKLFRRHGIGGRLLNKLVEHSKKFRKEKPGVEPWSEEAHCFFKKHVEVRKHRW